MNKFSLTNHMAQAAAVGLLALATPTTPLAVHAEDSIAAAAASSQLARDLVGAWVLVGSPGNVGEPSTSVRRLKVFAGNRWCITDSDFKSGMVSFHHGGTYTLTGDQYHEVVEYANPSTITFIGKTNGHFHIKLERDLLTLVGIDNRWQEVWKRAEPQVSAESDSAKPGQRLIGAWVLIGTSDKGGETPAGGSRLKLVTTSHWVDTQADARTGVVVVHHGGTYSLKGDEYAESIEFANPDTMGLVGRTFKFTTKLDGNTLTLKGVGNPWTEVWKRTR